MANKPLVTIIMATYNRAHFIEETLVSIQKQTYVHWECLIIDDGGTDGTLKILEPILRSDNRFTYLKRPESYKKGLPGCRNYGLDIAKGEFIVFFDDDDIVHPENLATCTRYLEKNNHSFCRYHRETFTGDFHYNFSKDKVISSFEVTPNDFKKLITNELPFNSCAVVWKKECFSAIRFEETLQYAEEWECYTRILTSGYYGISIDKTLFYGRKHPNSNTGEFWNNDPGRKASKVEACRLVIQHLASKNLLTYRLGVYFISLSHFLKEKQIFIYLRLHKEAFNTFEYLKLNLRYFGNGLISPLYKLKKRFT